MKNIFIIILLFFLLFCLTKCKTTEIRYIPVESKSTEYIDRFHRDSIIMYDSIHIKEKGDTVSIEKYKYLYRDKLVRDSVFITDSIAVPYPVEVVKEVNKLSLYQKVLTYLGLLFILLIILFLSYKYFKK